MFQTNSLRLLGDFARCYLWIDIAGANTDIDIWFKNRDKERGPEDKETLPLYSRMKNIRLSWKMKRTEYDGTIREKTEGAQDRKEYYQVSNHYMSNLLSGNFPMHSLELVSISVGELRQEWQKIFEEIERYQIQQVRSRSAKLFLQIDGLLKDTQVWYAMGKRLDDQIDTYRKLLSYYITPETDFLCDEIRYWEAIQSSKESNRSQKLKDYRAMPVDELEAIREFKSQIGKLEEGRTKIESFRNDSQNLIQLVSQATICTQDNMHY